jgi:hypothetical protein
VLLERRVGRSLQLGQQGRIAVGADLRLAPGAWARRQPAGLPPQPQLGADRRRRHPEPLRHGAVWLPGIHRGHNTFPQVE